jgi:hypothetical protein
MRFIVEWAAAVEADFVNAVTQAWLDKDQRKVDFLLQVAEWVEENLSEDPDEKGYRVKDLELDQELRLLPVEVESDKWLTAVGYTVESGPIVWKAYITRLTFR